jgi:hypothetical protein
MPTQRFVYLAHSEFPPRLKKTRAALAGAMQLFVATSMARIA